MLSPGFILVQLPDQLRFEDLNLVENSETGILEFDWAPVRAILEANPELRVTQEQHVLDLLCAWYSRLRLRGFRHAVAEEYLVDEEVEDAYGMQGFGDH